MSSRTILPAIAVTLLGSLAMGSAGFAQDAPPAHPADQSQGMMGGTGNMADMMNMMRQMTRMMEDCNRMMERADQNSPAPEKLPVAQTPPG